MFDVGHVGVFARANSISIEAEDCEGSSTNSRRNDEESTQEKFTEEDQGVWSMDSLVLLADYAGLNSEARRGVAKSCRSAEPKIQNFTQATKVENRLSGIIVNALDSIMLPDFTFFSALSPRPLVVRDGERNSVRSDFRKIYLAYITITFPQNSRHSTINILLS